MAEFDGRIVVTGFTADADTLRDGEDGETAAKVMGGMVKPGMVLMSTNSKSLLDLTLEQATMLLQKSRCPRKLTFRDMDLYQRIQEQLAQSRNK